MPIDNLLEQTCQRCNFVDEPRLRVNGPHLQADCQHCGRYIKFVTKVELPSIKAIRAKIWEVTNGDSALIETAKKFSWFKKHANYEQALVQYWNLYLQCRKIINEPKDVA